MILLCAEGRQSKKVGARLGVHEHTVGKWRRRFVKDRIEGLTDEYRPGKPARPGICPSIRAHCASVNVRLLKIATVFDLESDLTPDGNSLNADRSKRFSF